MNINDVNNQEILEWLESLQAIIETDGIQKAHFLLEKLISYSRRNGIRMPYTPYTDYLNTIPIEQQQKYPGNRRIERRISWWLAKL